MHPRSSYLAQADADASAREPLLEREDYPVLLPDAEPPVSATTTPDSSQAPLPPLPPLPGGKSDPDAEKSPHLKTPNKAEGYGLPSGYRAQYAGTDADIDLQHCMQCVQPVTPFCSCQAQQC